MNHGFRHYIQYKHRNHKYHDIGGRDLEESILNALKLKNNIDVKYRFSIARQLFTETTNLFEEQ